MEQADAQSFTYLLVELSKVSTWHIKELNVIQGHTVMVLWGHKPIAFSGLYSCGSQMFAHWKLSELISRKSAREQNKLGNKL